MGQYVKPLTHRTFCRLSLRLYLVVLPAQLLGAQLAVLGHGSDVVQPRAEHVRAGGAAAGGTGGAVIIAARRPIHRETRACGAGRCES